MSTSILSAFKNSQYLGVRVCVPPPVQPQPQPQPPQAASTKKTQIAILLDTSGSMKGERINTVRKTLHACRAFLTDSDILTVVTFNSDARILIDHLPMTSEGKDRFYSEIDAIEPSTCTNLEAGLETLISSQSTSSFDTVLLLTDGNITAGTARTSELRGLARGLTVYGSCPLICLGYGVEHNRTLLRDLAVYSSGSYVYVDVAEADETLPSVMGDLLEGLHSEVYKNAVVSVSAGWRCCEINGSGLSQFPVGNIVPGREYWAIFENSQSSPPSPSEVTSVTLSVVVDSVSTPIQTLHSVPVSDCLELDEQVLRCRVAAALFRASDSVENGRAMGTEIDRIAKDIDHGPEYLRERPLVVHMRKQLAEFIAIRDASPHGFPPPPLLMVRMSSSGATLGTQRSGGDPQAYLFSSPQQLSVAREIQETMLLSSSPVEKVDTPDPAFHPC